MGTLMMENSGPSNRPPRRRETDRKRRLREVLQLRHYREGVLLDELRWNVMGEDIAERESDDSRRSLLNSFARTVREQLPNYSIEKVRITNNTPVGLVARAAVYRLKDISALRRFLSAEESCILCRYKTNLDVDEPRYERSRYVVPHYHAAMFRFFEKRPASVTYSQLEVVPGAFIPATQKLTLIVPQGVTPDLNAIARVPWNLFAYENLEDWYECQGTDALSSVHRNRRG